MRVPLPQFEVVLRHKEPRWSGVESQHPACFSEDSHINSERLASRASNGRIESRSGAPPESGDLPFEGVFIPSKPLEVAGDRLNVPSSFGQLEQLVHGCNERIHGVRGARWHWRNSTSERNENSIVEGEVVEELAAKPTRVTLRRVADCW